MSGFFFVVGFLTVLLIILWKREPRSMLNAGVFGILLVSGYLFLMEISFYSGWGESLYAYLALALFIGLPLIYMLGSMLLIWNGRTMIRKEGMSLSHLLAPLVGSVPLLILFALIGSGFIALMGGQATSAVVLAILGIAIALYGYLLWTAWCTIPYGAFYTFWPKDRDPEVIIVHGAGLINDEVTPLLASRLDKAMELYERGGNHATIIPSGGQGEDESRSEAEAMAEYLVGKGVNPAHVVPEDQSTDTMENMRFSREIMERRGLDNPRVVFVTNNYHVFRTALIARRVGLNAQGVGSRTAKYYLPSAIIREFIAILVMYKWWHIVPIGAFIAFMLVISQLA